MNRTIHYFFMLACLMVKLVSFSSCANIIPPGGGPRDSLPPRLVSALPKDSSVNVSVKNMLLTFDEYVTLEAVQENLIISPTLKNLPLVDYKLRNVTIKIKDSLESNTTYTFNFGGSVKDVNEGNTAKGVSYVFSTGNKLDLNSYSGKVLLAETGKVDSTLIVVLHKNLADTAIVKERPRYYTRINGKGEFSFQNLPSGNFAVYVVPNDFTKKYDDSTKLFAFKNSPVAVSSITPSDTLFAFEEFKRKEKTLAVAAVKIPPGKDDKRLRYTLELENGQQDILNEFALNFNRKLTHFDSARFFLYDTAYHPLSGYTFLLDTNRTKVFLKYKWKEATPYRIIISKEAVSDSAGISLPKSDTLRFLTKRESDYGSIRLSFPNLDLSKHPVLQFVQSEKIIESVPLTQPVFTRKLFRPGAYDLRILFDANHNGSWDPGHFSGTKLQPEIVWFIPKPFNIKSNWDNEVTISL